MKNIFKFLTGLVVAASLYAAPSTRTFTANTTGTNPNTVTFTNNTISVDLTDLSESDVYSAHFYPGRLVMNGQQGSIWNTEPWVLIAGLNDTLVLTPPRFNTFDVTQLIRDSLSVGHASFRVVSAPGLNSANLQMAFRITSSLDFATSVQQPTNFSGRFKDGEIIFTFTEANTPALPTNPAFLDIFNARNALDNGEVVRYRLYKTKRNDNIDSAVKYGTFIDEVKNLSCWNFDLLPNDGGNPNAPIPTFPIDDLTPAAPGTGLYVHKHSLSTPDTNFYIISRSVNGVETFSNAPVTNSIVSSPGNGLVIMAENIYPANFMWESNPNVRRYVRWESYPNAPFPSSPHNYLIAVPQNYSLISPSPVTLSLHAWAGSMENPTLWWYNAPQRSIMVASMQVPYDWWTAFSPNTGTLKSLNGGHVEPFSQVRLLSFLFDHARTYFNLDTNRIMLAGMSMGGSGSSQFGLRGGHLFSEVNSMVGIHIPEMSPQYTVAYEGAYGPRSWDRRYTNPGLVRFGFPLIQLSDNISPWDYFNNTWWLPRNKSAKLPWFTLSNGENDDGIGWDQAWRNIRAFQDYRVPFNFVWGQGGHGQRPWRLGGDDRYSTVIANRSRSLPAFSNMASSVSIGNSSSTVADAGDINSNVNWTTDSDVDSVNRWSIGIGLANNGVEQTTVSVSPKRLTNFIIDTNRTFRYTYSLDNTILDTGVVVPDSNNNLTVDNLLISRNVLRTLEIVSTLKNNVPPDTTPPIDTTVPSDTLTRYILQVNQMICAGYENYNFLTFPYLNPSVPVDIWPDSLENSVRVFVDSKGIGVYGNNVKFEFDSNNLDSAYAFSRRIMVPIRKNELDSLGFVPCE